VKILRAALLTAVVSTILAGCAQSPTEPVERAPGVRFDGADSTASDSTGRGGFSLPHV
jgi:hypothetical protein